MCSCWLGSITANITLEFWAAVLTLAAFAGSLVVFRNSAERSERIMWLMLVVYAGLMLVGAATGVITGLIDEGIR